MSNGDAYAGIGYGQSIRSGMTGRYPAKSVSGKRENDKLKNHSYMLLMITLIFFLVQSQVHACEPVFFFFLPKIPFPLAKNQVDSSRKLLYY